MPINEFIENIRSLGSNREPARNGDRKEYDSETISQIMGKRLVSDFELFRGGAVFDGTRLHLTDDQIDGIALESIFGQTSQFIATLHHEDGLSIDELSDRRIDQEQMSERLRDLALPYNAEMFQSFVPLAKDNKRNLFGGVVNKGKVAKTGLVKRSKQSPMGTIDYFCEAQCVIGEERNTLSTMTLYFGAHDQIVAYDGAIPLTLAIGYTDTGRIDNIFLSEFRQPGKREPNSQQFKTIREVASGKHALTSEVDKFIVTKSMVGSGVVVYLHDEPRIEQTDVKHIRNYYDGLYSVLDVQRSLRYNSASHRFENTTGMDDSLSEIQGETILRELLQLIPIQEED